MNLFEAKIWNFERMPNFLRFLTCKQGGYVHNHLNQQLNGEMLFTVFGFGVCRFNKQMSDLWIPGNNKWTWGKLRFVPFPKPKAPTREELDALVLAINNFIKIVNENTEKTNSALKMISESLLDHNRLIELLNKKPLPPKKKKR